MSNGRNTCVRSSVVVPLARARHIYSATAGQGSPLKQRLLGRNRLRVIARCLPADLAARCLPAILAYDLLAIAYAALTRRPAIASGRLAALRCKSHSECVSKRSSRRCRLKASK